MCSIYICSVHELLCVWLQVKGKPAKNALNNELDNCYTKRIKILDKNGREKQKAFYKDKTAATLDRRKHEQMNVFQ